MQIKNKSNRHDVVTVSKSHKDGLVRLNIGVGRGARHSNLNPAEVRAVRRALRHYAEQG